MHVISQDRLPSGIVIDAADFCASPAYPRYISHLTPVLLLGSQQAALVLVQGLHLEDVLQQMYSTEPRRESDALSCR